MADSGIAELDAMIDRLRTLAGPKVGERVAARAAPRVDAAIKKTARAGTTPDGRPWKPKKDGGRPLVHAADHIQTRALGNIVVTTLTGPDAFHQKGLGGKPTRPIIPDAGTVPKGIKDAALEAAAEVVRELAEGKG